MKALSIQKVGESYKGVVLAKSNETSSITSTLEIGGVDYPMIDGSLIVEVDTKKKKILYDNQWYEI